MTLIRQLDNAIHIQMKGEPPDELDRDDGKYVYGCSLDGLNTYVYFRDSWLNG